MQCVPLVIRLRCRPHFQDQDIRDVRVGDSLCANQAWILKLANTDAELDISSFGTPARRLSAHAISRVFWGKAGRHTGERCSHKLIQFLCTHVEMLGTMAIIYCLCMFITVPCLQTVTQLF